MAKKRKRTPIVPTVPTAPNQVSTDKPTRRKLPQELSSGRSTAVLWLHGTLRIRDNAILARAVASGRDGLAVVVVWRHGRKVPTPSASFMAHAFRSLHAELRKLGSGLTVLHAAADTEKAASACVAAYVREACDLARCTVVVDSCGPAGSASAGLVASALPGATVVAMADDTLFPHDVAVSCLPASRSSPDARVLKWAGVPRSQRPDRKSVV